MTRECPNKGKGKGDMKRGGNGMTNDGFKGYGKGGGTKGGFKGDGKGSGYKGFEKGYWPKGEGKGGGYQGTCLKCGKVGHKAAECSMYIVGELRPEEEKPIGEVRNGGKPWVVAGVAEISKHQVKERMTMTLEAWMPNMVDLKNKYDEFEVGDEKRRSNRCD